jgi:cell division protein FtsW
VTTPTRSRRGDHPSLRGRPPVNDGRPAGRVPRARVPSGRRPVGRRNDLFLGLFALVVILNLIGLLMVLSASAVDALYEYGSSWYQFQRQFVWLILGAAALVVVMRVDYHRWRPFVGWFLLAAIALLVLVLVPGLGLEVNGASRWLGTGQFRIQPSEIAKLAVLLFAADLLARRADKVHDWRITLRPVVFVFAVVAVLIMAQPNLGTTLIVATIVLTVLFVAGVRLKPLGVVATTGVALASLAAFAAPYRYRRLMAFRDPWADPLNTGYQTIQSQIGIANGGLLGVGLGEGRAKWGFLPFPHTDFIFAIIGEEFGLLGSLLVVALFVGVGVLGVRTALRAPDAFGMLIAAGVTTWILVQAFVNIGAVVGVLPITGVPLPFVSFGGSSLLVAMAAAGLLLNVARQAR